MLRTPELTGRDPASDFSRRSGVVVVPSGNGLVSNAPLTADGTLSEASLLDQRVHISLGETEGPDAAGAGVKANPFAGLRRQRIGNVSGELWRNGEDGLRFSTTVAESDGMVIDESTGLPTSEERTSIFGGGLSFTTANNRLRGVAEMAWSRNTESEILIEGDSARREQADLAWHTRLDADLLKGDSHALTAWVFKRRIAPGYVAVHGGAPVDRDETAIGGHVRLGSTTLDLSFAEFTDNLDRKPGVLTRHDRAATATLGFDLHEYRTGPLSPSALRLTTTVGSLTGLPEESNGLFGDTATDQRRLGFGVAVDWPVSLFGGNDLLTLSATRLRIDERQPERETADTLEDSVSLIYTATRPYWTGSMAATAADITNAEAGNRSETHRYSFSAYAATTAQAGSRLSLTVNVSHQRTNPLDPGVDGDIETIWDVTAGGEINRLIGAERIAGVLPIVAYLRIAGNDPDRPEHDRRDVEVTAGVKARILF